MLRACHAIGGRIHKTQHVTICLDRLPAPMLYCASGTIEGSFYGGVKQRTHARIFRKLRAAGVRPDI